MTVGSSDSSNSSHNSSDNEGHGDAFDSNIKFLWDLAKNSYYYCKDPKLMVDDGGGGGRGRKNKVPSQEVIIWTGNWLSMWDEFQLA